MSTASDLFNAIVALGETSREEIDAFFSALLDETLDNKILMTLTPNDSGTVYTTVDNKTITIKAPQ